MDCTVMNYAEGSEATYIDKSGKEVCRDTRLLSMSLEGFVQVYTDQQGGEFESNLSKISGSGYKKKPKDNKKAENFNLKSKGRGAQTTTLITARLEEEIRDSLTLNYPAQVR